MRALRASGARPSTCSMAAVRPSSSSAPKPLLVVCSMQPYGYFNRSFSALANGSGGRLDTVSRAVTESASRPSMPSAPSVTGSSVSRARGVERSTPGHAARTTISKWRSMRMSPAGGDTDAATTVILPTP